MKHLATEFEDPYIRRRFIRKTYVILAFQLFLTFGSMLIVKFLYEYEAFIFFYTHMWLMWTALAVSMFIVLLLSCVPVVARKKPYNYIFLLIFTVLFSYLMLSFAFRYEPDLILMAMGITFAITITITIGACISKIDVTNWWFFVLLLAIVIIGLGIASIFIHDRTFQIVYSAIGLAIYCFFLFYDTQLMLGGKHRVAFSTDDYVLAAMCLYLDILEIFIHLTRLMSAAQD